MNNKRKDIIEICLLFLLLFFILWLMIALPLAVMGSWNEKDYGSATSPVSELKSSIITIPINRGFIVGKYELQVYFSADDFSPVKEKLTQIQAPVSFELSVQVRRNKKTVEKTFSTVFDGENYPGRFHLFSIFLETFGLYRENAEITIKDIKFDDILARNFQTVTFRLVHPDLFPWITKWL